MQAKYKNSLKALLSKPTFVYMLKQVDETKIGPNKESLKKHMMYCSGCSDCTPYVELMKLKKSLLEKNEIVDDISWEQAMEMRKTHSIHYWFPRGDEMRKPDGSLDKWVYIWLKNQDAPGGKRFTDEEIFDYFDINSGEQQTFKKRYFPNYGKDRETITLEQSLVADEYVKKHFNFRRTTKVKKII